ncbi:MAG TPA: 2-oxoglutarate ferredoxin oxidoreductase subunit alpha [Elusimicrobia bacterium]|nr:2-oxoglutarate ferredoxin oxidoreductase subunit alpha [Elusimicrobiota bacterium]
MKDQTAANKHPKAGKKPSRELEAVTIRFAGDSGDGIQLTGGQFTNSTAALGNDLSTLPDYPAEIRAPAGSLPGVSGFQIQFSSRKVLTPGDRPQVLVAFNPAALKVNLKSLEPGALIIANKDAFGEANLKKAAYEKNPLEDGSLSAYRVLAVEMTHLTEHALADLKLARPQVERCKNFFALGIMYWIYERPLEPTQAWIRGKFAKRPELMEANLRALQAGHVYAETAEIFEHTYRVKRAPIRPGRYRNIMGNEAAALGLVAASRLAKKELYLGSYPITPATEILQFLSGYKGHRVKVLQAEDEIAAVCSSIGASFAGCLAATSTSGPGLALKSEAMGLAVITELPLVIINVQRGGPSTGLPTKTEQADLFQAIFGRNGESPLVVLAAATPSDCFTMTVEAARIAIKYMTPVVMLSDGYLANGSEPWRVPTLDELPKFEVPSAGEPAGFAPYKRDPKTLSRPWAVPGMPGFEHRIGGLEKQDVTGSVSYDADNHERMSRLRAEKIARVADEIPSTQVLGQPSGKVLVVGWGSTYGAITAAVQSLQAEGQPVSSIHLRNLWPLPPDLGSILKRFERVLVPEINLGQLLFLLRERYLLPAVGLNKVKGQPFRVDEVRQGILEQLQAKG